MSQYILSPEALDDLQGVWDFVAEDNVDVANKVLEKLFESFYSLAQWPRQGHKRQDLTTRDVLFWPVGSYLIVYRSTSTKVQIVAVLHGSRDVPNIIEGR